MKIKRKHLNSFIEKFVKANLEEWRTEDNTPAPAVVNEPFEVGDVVEVEPLSDTQLAPTSLPIQDKKWKPGNLHELGLALRQIADMVPESEISWFYAKVHNLVNKSLDRVDTKRMEPRLGDDEK